MKYLLNIENFQSVKEAHLEIEGLTILYSPKSNVGKSSVVRALQGVLFGKSFRGMVTKGAKATKVIFGWDIDGDKHLIAWNKGDGINSVKVDGTVFDKLGQNYPEEVQKIGFRHPNLEGMEIPLQIREQFDKAFPMNLTSSDLGRVVSHIVDMSEMNETIKRALGDKSKLASIKTFILSELESIDKKLAQLDKVPNLALAVAQMDPDDLLTKENRLMKLQALSERLRDLKEQDNILQRTTPKIPVLADMAPKIGNLESIKQLAKRYYLALNSDKAVKQLPSISELYKIRIDVKDSLKTIVKLHELRKYDIDRGFIFVDQYRLEKQITECVKERDDLGYVPCTVCSGTGVVQKNYSVKEIEQ